jgi:hypothetical protein
MVCRDPPRSENPRELSFGRDPELLTTDPFSQWETRRRAEDVRDHPATQKHGKTPQVWAANGTSALLSHQPEHPHPTTPALLHAESTDKATHTYARLCLSTEPGSARRPAETA